MRRLAVRLSYIAVPLIAICAFLFVQQQMNGLAPAPPASIPGPVELDARKETKPSQPRPTVLAPDDAEFPSAAEIPQPRWTDAVMSGSSSNLRQDFTPPYDPSDLEVHPSVIVVPPQSARSAAYSTARANDATDSDSGLELR